MLYLQRRCGNGTDYDRRTVLGQGVRHSRQGEHGVREAVIARQNEGPAGEADDGIRPSDADRGGTNEKERRLYCRARARGCGRRFCIGGAKWIRYLKNCGTGTSTRWKRSAAAVRNTRS